APDPHVVRARDVRCPAARLRVQRGSDRPRRALRRARKGLPCVPHRHRGGGRGWRACRVPPRTRGREPHRIEGLDLQATTASYFIGRDPTGWRSHIPTFGRVRYAEVYPGVDVIFYGNDQRLE